MALIKQSPINSPSTIAKSFPTCFPKVAYPITSSSNIPTHPPPLQRCKQLATTHMVKSATDPPRPGLPLSRSPLLSPLPYPTLPLATVTRPRSSQTARHTFGVAMTSGKQVRGPPRQSSHPPKSRPSQPPKTSPSVPIVRSSSCQT